MKLVSQKFGANIFGDNLASDNRNIKENKLEVEQTLPADKTNDELYSRTTASSKIIGKVVLDEPIAKSSVDCRVIPATCNTCKWFLVNINSVDEPTGNKYGYCREPDSYKENVDGDDTCELHRPRKLSV